MTFFFTLPQTLLRQLAIRELSLERKFIFIPESETSTTGRDNDQNFLISTKLLKKIRPNARITLGTEEDLAFARASDGIGDELLRTSNAYEKRVTGHWEYLVQHSCLGWESVNLRGVLHPLMLARSLVRSNRRFKGKSFRKVFVYAGENEIKLRRSWQPLRKIQVIPHDMMANVARLASSVVEIEKKFVISSGVAIFLPAGNCEQDFKKTISWVKKNDLSLVVKAHPQQKYNLGILPESLKDFEKQHFLLVDNSIPAEIIIEKCNPIAIFGPPSTIKYYSRSKYHEYIPDQWPQLLEAKLIQTYRELLLGNGNFPFLPIINL